MHHAKMVGLSCFPRLAKRKPMMSRYYSRLFLILTAWMMRYGVCELLTMNIKELAGCSRYGALAKCST